MEANDEKRDRTLDEAKRSTGYTPSTPNTTDEDRSLEIGEAGQFAPGGYYNQQRKDAPRRIDLDDELVPRRHVDEHR